MTPVFQTGMVRLFAGNPLALGQHGAGLLAGCTVDQVVASGIVVTVKIRLDTNL